MGVLNLPFLLTLITKRLSEGVTNTLTAASIAKVVSRRFLIARTWDRIQFSLFGIVEKVALGQAVPCQNISIAIPFSLMQHLGLLAL
jgi:hypothetical protein